MEKNWRNGIPTNKAIIAMVRHATRGDIKRWAKENNLNRTLIYLSSKGKGTRPYRLLLARIVKQKPSLLWPDRNNLINIRDDLAYEEHEDLTSTEVAE